MASSAGIWVALSHGGYLTAPEVTRASVVRLVRFSISGSCSRMKEYNGAATKMVE